MRLSLQACLTAASSRGIGTAERALRQGAHLVHHAARQGGASSPQLAWDRPFHRTAHRDVPTLHSTPLLPCTVRKPNLDRIDLQPLRCNPEFHALISSRSLSIVGQDLSLLRPSHAPATERSGI